MNIRALSIVVVSILFLFSSCQKDGGDTTIQSSAINNTEILTFSITDNNNETIINTAKQADDYLPTPDGYRYVANINNYNNDENEWLPIQTVELCLKKPTSSAFIQYRNYIETKAGETRNNILIVNIPRSPANTNYINVVISLMNAHNGIEINNGPMYQEYGLSCIILEFVISTNIDPGEYGIEIGIEIDGEDYGIVPCTIRVI